MSTGAILLFALMGATVLVLVAGIVLMARGGAPNAKYSNKLMSLRVLFQGAALGVMALLLLIAGK